MTKKEASGRTQKKKKSSKKGLKIIGYAIIICFIVLAGYLMANSLLGSFENDIAKIAELDDLYGVSMDDYYLGIIHLKWHPRENPVGIGEYHLIISSFESTKSKLKTPAGNLYAEARINLLKSEHQFRISTNHSSKRTDDDKITCSEKEELRIGAEEVGFSIEYASVALKNLQDFIVLYPEEQDKLQISKFWLRTFELTIDEMNDDMEKRKKATTFLQKKCNVNSSSVPPLDPDPMIFE
ncbi:hypothetical protein ACFL0W_05550 [Nanoarchaeota archaeon]